MSAPERLLQITNAIAKLKEEIPERATEWASGPESFLCPWSLLGGNYDSAPTRQ